MNSTDEHAAAQDKLKEGDDALRANQEPGEQRTVLRPMEVSVEIALLDMQRATATINFYSQCAARELAAFGNWGSDWQTATGVEQQNYDAARAIAEKASSMEPKGT